MKSTFDDIKPYLEATGNFIIYLIGVCGLIVIGYLFNKAGLSEYRVYIIGFSAVLIFILIHYLFLDKSFFATHKLSNLKIFIIFLLVAHIAVISLSLAIASLFLFIIDFLYIIMNLKGFWKEFIVFMSFGKKISGFLYYWTSNNLNIPIFWISLSILYILAGFIISHRKVLLQNDNKSENDRKLYEHITRYIFPFFAILFSLSFASIMLNYIKILIEPNPNLFYISLTIISVILFFPFTVYTFIQIIYYLYSLLGKKEKSESKKTNKTEIVNVHCHLLNYDYIPDSFLSGMIPTDFPFPVNKRILRLPLIVDILKKALPFLPIKTDKLTAEWLEILFRQMLSDKISDRKKIPEQNWTVPEVYLDEMEKANKIMLSVPLVMDLNIHSYNTHPGIAYIDQVNEISQVAARYPFKLMPFVMFDPRRKGAMEIVTDALENKGFLGVKLYPSMGYSPDYESKYNNSEINNQLKELYRYCIKNHIPITVHSAKGGATAQTQAAQSNIPDRYSHPNNWNEILHKTSTKKDKAESVELKDMIVNLAHFGGDLHKEEEKKKTQEEKAGWEELRHKEILELLSHDGINNVYTDISCNLLNLTKDNKTRYFDRLKEALKSKTGKKIMFGTDWMMTRRTYKEQDFVNEYVENLESLNEEEKNNFFVLNAIRFLFPERNNSKYGRIPKRIADFHLKTYKKEKDEFETKDGYSWENYELSDEDKTNLNTDYTIDSKVKNELALFYEIYRYEKLRQEQFSKDKKPEKKYSDVIGDSKPLKSLIWLIQQFAKLKD